MDIDLETRNILLVEDNRADAGLIRSALAEVEYTRFEIAWGDSMQRALDVRRSGVCGTRVTCSLPKPKW
jgi:hypothetical protein